MSAEEKARQIVELLRRREHADQAVALVESLGDAEVNREVARKLRFSGGVYGRWSGTEAQLRVLIACGPAASEATLSRISLRSWQLALPGIEHVLTNAHDLLVLGSDDELVDATLPAMPRLQTVYLGGVSVDLSSLRDAPGLQTLGVHGRVLNDGLPLHHLAEPTRIEVRKAPVLRSLDALEGRRSVRELAIVGAPLRDLGPLASLTSLHVLDLRECRLGSLEPLARLSELRVIALHGTGKQPEDVPATVRPYCTWTPEPSLRDLGKRPKHPDV